MLAALALLDFAGALLIQLVWNEQQTLQESQKEQGAENVKRGSKAEQVVHQRAERWTDDCSEADGGLHVAEYRFQLIRIRDTNYRKLRRDGERVSVPLEEADEDSQNVESYPLRVVEVVERAEASGCDAEDEVRDENGVLPAHSIDGQLMNLRENDA